MTKPNDSKYDEFFDINHTTKKAVCKQCGKTLSKNCSGMNGHLKSKHGIIVLVQNSNDNVVGNGIPSPSKKLKRPFLKSNEVEPIEDQICREVAKYGASFR